MVFFLFFLLIKEQKIPFEIHQCSHDFTQDKLLRSLPPEKLRSTKAAVNQDLEEDFKDIRIIFNTDSIAQDIIDAGQCRSTTQENCQSGDILEGDRTKIQGIINTFSNIQTFLNGLIKCRRLIDPVDVSRYNRFSEMPGLPESASDVDLYIVVIARPYGAGSNTLAQARTIDWDGVGRAVLGEININANALDDLDINGQSQTSADRQFFTTLLHELNHILSFSGSNFNRWKNESGLNYENHIIELVNNFNMTQTFIRSPKITQWINKRFYVHSEELSNLGLELEDGGGTGTAGSHPNSRLYFTDLMQGKTYGVAYITDIFFLILEDTGWYKLNQTLVDQRKEEFVYLDVERVSSLERAHETLLTSPPQTSFPEAYQCTEERYGHCFYDYRQKGRCQKITREELLNLSYVNNETIAWYNPQNRASVGMEELVDHADIILPNYLNCRSTAARDRAINEPDINYNPDNYGETYGPNSICAESTLYHDNWGTFLSEPLASCYEAWCGTDYKVRLLIKGHEYLCEEDGQRITVEGFNGYIICPPGRAACATMNRVEVINVKNIIPRQGPVDGQNLIVINGNDFSKYDDINITIGPTKCTIVQRDDSRILCRVDPIPEGERNSYKGKYASFTVVSPSVNISNSIDNGYYFTTYTYSAGIKSAVPAIALLVGTIIASFFV